MWGTTEGEVRGQRQEPIAPTRDKTESPRIFFRNCFYVSLFYLLMCVQAVTRDQISTF